MADKKFDPKKFIDRKFEQDLFETLLEFKDETRILSICDTGGMGKTQLLQKLDHRCRTVKPRTPVSFIALDEPKFQDPLTLIKTMAQDLSGPFGLEFPNFNKYDIARASGDFSPILSSIYFQGANFSGASDIRAAGAMANVGHANTINVTSTGVGTLTPEQQGIANEVCIGAFFDDLKKCAAKSPVVLLLDTFEKCDSEFSNWIINYLLARHFFDLANRPGRLVLVVAGRKAPEFDENWTLDDIKTVVKSRELGRWEKDHVEECLVVNGFIYEQKDLEFFWLCVQQGLPPSYIIQGMELSLRRQN